MALNDILLHLDSYPEATPPEAVDQAVAFVARVGGKLSALAVQVKIPLHSNRVADYLIGLTAIARDEEAKSLVACREGLDHFTARARDAGVFGEALLDAVDLYSVSDHVAHRARTRDLCVVPLAKPLYGQAEVVRSLIFASGRPALVFHAQNGQIASAPGTVVVAWDGSQRAARALADALPILTAAKAVRVFTAVSEKPSAVKGMGADVVRHLQTHGIAATADDVEADGRPIGKVLDKYLKDVAAGLLVMGAYGRPSGLRDFVWGGATEHMLHDPKVPLFLSH